MCVHSHNLLEHKTVQLIKDFTTDHALGVAKFYLDTNEEWIVSKLVEHLQILFESCKTFSSLLGEFYSQYKKSKEMDGQFTAEL